MNAFERVIILKPNLGGGVGAEDLRIVGYRRHERCRWRWLRAPSKPCGSCTTLIRVASNTPSNQACRTPEGERMVWGLDNIPFLLESHGFLDEHQHPYPLVKGCGSALRPRGQPA